MFIKKNCNERTKEKLEDSKRNGGCKKMEMTAVNNILMNIIKMIQILNKKGYYTDMKREKGDGVNKRDDFKIQIIYDRHRCHLSCQYHSGS